MPYAKIHNESFEGTVSVKAYTRNQYSKTQISTGKFTKKEKERKKTVTFKSGEKVGKALHTQKSKITKGNSFQQLIRPKLRLNRAIINRVK